MALLVSGLIKNMKNMAVFTLLYTAATKDYVMKEQIIFKCIKSTVNSNIVGNFHSNCHSNWVTLLWVRQESKVFCNTLHFLTRNFVKWLGLTTTFYRQVILLVIIAVWSESFGLVTEHRHYNARRLPRAFTTMHVIYFFSLSVVSRTFSALCMYSKFGHHPHPLGYVCAKFCFFCGRPLLS